MAMPAAVTLSDCDCSMCRGHAEIAELDADLGARFEHWAAFVEIVGQARPGADEHDVIGLDVAMDECRGDGPRQAARAASAMMLSRVFRAASCAVPALCRGLLPL